MHSELRQFIAKQDSKLIAKEEEDRWSTVYAKYLAKWESSFRAKLILFTVTLLPVTINHTSLMNSLSQFNLRMNDILLTLYLSLKILYDSTYETWYCLYLQSIYFIEVFLHKIFLLLFCCAFV